MTLAACYTRVSSDEQTQGASLDDQRAACRKAAQDAGHEVTLEATDPGISGATWPRPGLQSLLTRAGEYEVLWLWDYSRLARDDELHGYLRWSFRAAGVEIRTVCDPGARPLEIGLHAIIAAEQRRAIRAATIRALESRAGRGQYNGGGAPTGYRWVDGALTVYAPEAERILAAVAAIEAGESANASAATLGITPSHAARLLRRPTLAGAYAWGDTLTWGAHEPILEPARWERLQAILDARRYPRGRHRTLALSGLLRCPCGEAARAARISRPRHLERCYRYACPRCRHGWTTRGWVAGILRTLVESLAETEIVAELVAAANAGCPRLPDTARLDRAERTVIDLASDGTISAADARARLAPLRAQRSRVLADRQVVRLVTPGEVRERLARVVAVLQATESLPDLDHEARLVLHRTLVAITLTGRAAADLALRWGDTVAATLPGGNSRGRPGATPCNVVIPWRLVA